MHDILGAWRDWDGVRVETSSSSSSNGSEYYLRFCIFSAALLKEIRGEKNEVHPVWVFYACREVLEPKPVVSQQLWTLDVRIAATWVRVGGLAFLRD